MAEAEDDVELPLIPPPVVPPEVVEKFFTPSIVSDDAETVSAAVADMLSSGSLAARDLRKPSIAHLDDAVARLEDGTILPLFVEGEKIVIERRCSTLVGNPWLDTMTYTVKTIDDETGVLRLWNDELRQNAYGNFITGPARGDVYKLASKARGVPNIGKKKRGRPRKNPIVPPPVAADPNVPKRGRGRPKGSKNRSKEVIAAERLEKAALKKAKKKVKR